MTKIKSFSKKALSIVLTLVMCLTLIPLMSDTAPEADAATAGLYDIKVEITVTDGADGWDQNDHYVNHKANNGTGSQTAQSVGISTGNMDEEKTHTFTYSNKGFPTSYTYNYSFGGGLTWRSCGFTLKVYASKAGANSWKQVMTGTFSAESSAFSAAKGTWTCSASTNIAAPSSISWTNTAKSVTIPKSGTATAATYSATVYDQYGVEWYQEPYYALNSSSNATSTTETISGITRTTSQSDTCTVSVTNSAKTWVSNGGSSSRDVYVTAYINSVKSTTTKFTINQVQYNIKFYNGDTLLNTASENQKFYYNVQPYYNGTPTKAADAQYTYVFDGWNTSNTNTAEGSPAYTNATLPVANGDTSYYAHYNKITNQYTVTFKNDDGTTLQSGKLYYGDTPVYSGTPVKESTPQYSYVFAGWTPEISEVTEEVIYTATYNAVLNKYTVVFKNYDGTVLQESACDYGSIPSCSITPVKPSDEKYDYVFKGWNPTVNPVTGDAEYTAAFTAVKRSYPVVFKNYDGTVLQNTAWEYGTTPSYSGTPVRESNAEFTYTFTGWSPAIVSVTGNAEYTAVFEAKKNEYTVYYKNYDGSAVSEETVLYGEAAQMADSLSPVKPAADGKTYVFAGWSAELGSITKNTYAVAQYAVEGVENYWITFVDSDGTVLYKTIVEEGGTAVYGGEEPANEGYSFVGWDKPLTDITEDTTVYALYAKDGEQYVVTYVDWDDTFIVSMIVNHGEDAVAPAAPVREGDENTVYTFTGWDNDGTNVTENLVIKATYSVHSHEYNTFVENVIPADCITNRTDKFSCSCGLTKDIEIEDSKDADNHTGPLTITGEEKATCTENGYTGDMVCDACGEIAEYGQDIISQGHTKGDLTIEDVKSASCTVAGEYDEVYYCTECGEEISRTHEVGEKLPHTEEEIPAVAPTCTVDGTTAGVKCSVCDEVLTAPETDLATGHTPKAAVKENETEATCKVAAYYEDVVYCETCDEEISRTPVYGTTLPHTEEEIPAVAPTCTVDGTTAGVKCSVCGDILTAPETDPATGHTEEEIPAIAPTCTEDGMTAGVKCSVCKEILEIQTLDPATGHTPKGAVKENETEATCKVAAYHEDVVYCEICDAEISRTPVFGTTLPHTEEEISAVAPTCTEDGMTAGVKCSVCGDVLTAPETDPATGHTEEEIPAVAPTCTVDGTTAGVKCSVCDEVLTAPETDPATGHNWGEWFTVIPASCGSDGKDKRVCKNNEEHFEEKTVYATGDHVYTTEIERVNATCTDDGYVIKACLCGAEEKTILTADGHKEEIIPAVAPTCTVDGTTAGVKCSVCDEVLAAPETDPATGHTPKAAVKENETEATCKVAAYHEEVVYCEICDAEISRTPVYGTTLPHTEEEIPAVAPTCTVDGTTAGVKCSVCGDVLTAPETDPATGHTPKAAVKENETEATCKVAAYHEDVVYCETCDEEISRTPVYGTTLPHTEEEIPAVAPTCTVDGTTAGVKCSVCDEVLTAPETDPATGHTPKAAVKENETEATCKVAAYHEEVVYCEICDAEISRTPVFGATLPHTEEEIPAVAPSCTKTGLTAGIKCTVCGEIVKAPETVGKTAHDMSEWTLVKAPTCTEEGLEESVCTVCGYKETRTLSEKDHEYDENGVCTECGKEENCPHICHKEHNIFARIVWGIIRFFCSLFGVGRTCSCGAAHY